MIAAAALPLAASGCGEAERAPAAPAAPPAPQQVIESFRLTETRDGVPQWTVTSPRAVETPEGGRVAITAPRLVIFEPDGRVASTVTAARGDLQRATENVVARGDVTIRASSGLVVEADSLVWTNATRRLSTGSAVRIRKGGSVLTGVGFESDAGLRQYRVLADLRARVYEDELDAK